MARKRILLVLAAIAASLLVLGTVLVSQQRYMLAGWITCDSPCHPLPPDGYMGACYESTSPPSTGECTDAEYDDQQDEWRYQFLSVPEGTYLVWAFWETQGKLCTCPKEEVQVSGNTEHDLEIESEDCQYYP